MEKETSNTTTSNEERDLLKEKNTLEAIESKFTAVVCYPHFMIGITPKGIYIIKKKNGEYYIEKEIPHDWEVAFGNPVMLNGELYLWTHGTCYALVNTSNTGLLSNPKARLSKPLWTLRNRETLSDYDIEEMQDWHWHEIDADDFLFGYLGASGRSDLNTRVTDRESRARNREYALEELCSKDWARNVEVRENQAWSIQQEILKIDKNSTLSNGNVRRRFVKRRRMRSAKKLLLRRTISLQHCLPSFWVVLVLTNSIWARLLMV